MPIQIPSDIANKVKEIVYAAANEFCYLTRSRSDNSQFVNQLVGRKDVGGFLADYMKPSEVRTYIKDAILNRYTKNISRDLRPSPETLRKKCEQIYQISNLEILENTHDILYLWNKEQKVYIVIANGTYLKWETAVKRALLSTEDLPFARPDAHSTIYFMLSLFARKQKILSSEKNILFKSLKRIGFKAIFYGEI